MASDGFAPRLGGTLSVAEARELNPLVLAYVGDGVQMLYLKAKFASSSHAKAGKLHTLVSGQVRATSQAKAASALADALDDEERAVFLRARNSHVGTAAKHASIAEYHMATGLEAVFGYLYLTGRSDRLERLLGAAEEICAD